MATPQVRIFDNPQALFDGAAEEFASRAQKSVAKTGRFTVALSGGSTPKALYSELAGRKFASLPWNKIFFFWGDERHVGPDSHDSNYRMVNNALLSKVPVPAENIFRVRAEGTDADVVAREYEKTVVNFFALKPGEFPRFDLVLLGLGPDGHTASLFPDSKGLKEENKIFIANRVEKMDTNRLTFTYPVLNTAACDMFLVSGEGKKEKVRQILEERQDFPATKVDPKNGELLWFVDRAAAGK
ncbi:MAG TPA: 6-phosphogluconolactonase [Terriglobales bacterium]|jgi:6-phosphogluconolactonase|nr:6-phosphogluconolactonase [Terriglobales bacterium]